MTAPPPTLLPQAAAPSPEPQAPIPAPEPYRAGDLEAEPMYRTATFAMPNAALPIVKRAAPSAPAVAPAVAEDAEAWFRRLRALRAEVQDLRDVFREVQRGGAPLSRYVGYIGKTCADIDDLVRDIGDDDDCVRHARNAWEQMRTCELLSAPDKALDPQAQTQLLNLLDAQARRIVFWTSYRTIPNRLMHWLQETQPGYAIPFHAVFEDEVPDAEDRQKILNHLACTPEALKDVGGLVDPENGLVYRYDASELRRLWSLGKLALVIAALTAAVAYSGAVLAVPPQPTWTPRALLLGWGAVLVGAATHVAVAAAKRMRARTANPAVLPVGKLMLLVNAKEGLLLLRTAMAVIGFFALAYASGMPDARHFGTFLLNAFLVGYSLDSVVELFGSGMDQRAAALQAGLKARLGTSA